MTSETRGRFKRWFWRPPRPHGEAIANRQVSTLELFYDLVYVAVIGRRPTPWPSASRSAAGRVRRRLRADLDRVDQRLAVPGLHGREDGRTRSIVFVQMGILVLLAVFTTEAADGSGRGFPVVHATSQVVQTGLWLSVWRQDRRDHPEYQAATGGCWPASAYRRRSSWPAPSSPPPATDRVGRPWGRLDRRHRAGRPELPRRPGPDPHDSLVERFGLFTIIVLGEVVLGSWSAYSAAERDVKTIITGMLALWLGFGLWWSTSIWSAAGWPEPTVARWRIR